MRAKIEDGNWLDLWLPWLRMNSKVLHKVNNSTFLMFLLIWTDDLESWYNGEFDYTIDGLERKYDI